MNRIGIVGQGFVGTAVREGLRDHFVISTYDKNKQEDFAVESLRELALNSDVIFVCLPTPMRKSGECDIRIVVSVIKNINNMIEGQGKKKITVIKSTVPPGTTSGLNNLCKNLDIVFNPEFLTEANSVNDYKNQNRIILGGSKAATSSLKILFRSVFSEASIVLTEPGIAEMVKYFTNCFLATKVSFSNEMKQICDTSEIDYDKVVEYALYDSRLGKSHWSVPGPDGDFGFGGHCFPKDLCAMIDIAKKAGVSPLMLNAARNKNNEVRKSRDWETMLGRAISED